MTFIMWLLTWTPSLVVTGGLGLVGLIGPMLGAFRQWAMLARVLGLILLCLHCFLWGFRVADDRAEQKATIDRLTAENSALLGQLSVQASVSEIASKQRAAMLTERNEAQRLAETYKRQLEQPPTDKKAAHDPCAIDDADLRFYRSLRRRP